MDIHDQSHEILTDSYIILDRDRLDNKLKKMVFQKILNKIMTSGRKAIGGYWSVTGFVGDLFTMKDF